MAQLQWRNVLDLHVFLTKLVRCVTAVVLLPVDSCFESRHYVTFIRGTLPSIEYRIGNVVMIFKLLIDAL